MRRGILTGKACTSCRKKKRKCDGLTPCSNCRSRQDECTYNPTRWTSKDGLRSEIMEFKKREAITETVIDALRSPTRGAPVLEQLQRGESLADIENKLLGGAARASSSASTARRPYSDFSSDLDPDAEGEYDNEGDGVADDSEMRSPSPFSRASSASAAFARPQARMPVPSNSSSSSSIMTPAVPGGFGGGAQFFPRHWGEIHLSPGSASSPSLASVSPSVPSPPQPQPPQQHQQHQPHAHHHRVGGGGGFDASKKQPTFSLAMVEHLLDLLFTWECPPLTMITREAFTADFVMGRQNRYCSWPLIYAIVAVTSRLQDTAAADALKTPTNVSAASTSTSTTSTSTPTLEATPICGSTSTSPSPGPTNTDVPGYHGYPGGHELSGQLYFEQGYRMLAEQRQCESLADIQALGLLSLREVCNGSEASARVLAQRCLRDISAIRRRGTVEDGTFHAATAETYAGAFCLASMLDLVTYSQPGASRSLAWHASNQFEGGGGNLATPILTTPQGGTDQQHQHMGLQHQVAARHVNLTTGSGGGREDISSGYQTPAMPGFAGSGKRVETFSDVVVQITTLACSRMNLTGSGNDSGFVLDVYEKCLEWYNSALGMVQVGAGWTTSSLFLHMFYHFSLGVLFRPLLDQAELVFRKGTISPRVICAESAQAVLALAQSFARAFSLRRPPTFVPYFVYAAGLLQMELARASSPRMGQEQQQQQYQNMQQQQQHGQAQFQQAGQEQQHPHQLMRQGSDLGSGQQMGALKLGPSAVVGMSPGGSAAAAAQGSAEALVLQYLSEMAQTHPAAAEALSDLRKRLLGG